MLAEHICNVNVWQGLHVISVFLQRSSLRDEIVIRLLRKWVLLLVDNVVVKQVIYIAVKYASVQIVNKSTSKNNLADYITQRLPRNFIVPPHVLF